MCMCSATMTRVSPSRRRFRRPGPNAYGCISCAIGRGLPIGLASPGYACTSASGPSNATRNPTYSTLTRRSPMANPMTRAERHKVSQEAQRVRALIAKLSPERRKAFKRELARMGDPRYDSPPSPSQQEARQVGGKTQARGIATQSSKRTGDLPARARAKLWHEERVRAKAEGREPRQTRQARPGGGRLTDREVMDIVN